MITIVGGGPVGSYLGYLLRSEDVQVFEEHNTIGQPIQCTGITTSALDNVVKIKKDFLINRVSRARVFSPDERFVDVKLTNKNLVINRTAFDTYLANKAQDSGVTFHTGQRFLGFKGNKLHFKGQIKEAFTDVLVGADGARSQVARSAELWSDRKFVVGMQVRAKLEADPELVEFYLFKKGFGWVVPECDNIARIGVCAYENPKMYYDALLKKRAPKCKTLENQSGIIPIYDPRLKTQKDNVFLVGDAATQVKATTLGGIVQGMMAAEELAKAIKENKSYEKLWRKRIGTDLWLNLMMRKKLNKFSDKDYNRLIGYFKKDKLREVIETHDRDFPSKFLLNLLLREPRLLRFAL